MGKLTTDELLTEAARYDHLSDGKSHLIHMLAARVRELSEDGYRGYATHEAGTGLHMDGTIPQWFRRQGGKDAIPKGMRVRIIPEVTQTVEPCRFCGGTNISYEGEFNEPWCPNCGTSRV